MAGPSIRGAFQRTSIVFLYQCKRSFICSVTRLKNLLNDQDEVMSTEMSPELLTLKGMKHGS